MTTLPPSEAEARERQIQALWNAHREFEGQDPVPIPLNQTDARNLYASMLDRLATLPPQDSSGDARERELLRASPDDYWQPIVEEVERAGKQVRHAMLLNHQAAHLLAWAKIARDAALSLSQDRSEGVLRDALEALAGEDAVYLTGVEDDNRRVAIFTNAGTIRRARAALGSQHRPAPVDEAAVADDTHTGPDYFGERPTNEQIVDEAIANLKRDLAALTASPPSSDRLTNHKWLDSQCVEAGCQSLFLKEATTLLKRLTLKARTSGGTAGPDAGLMKACEEAEAFLTSRQALSDQEPNHVK